MMCNRKIRYQIKLCSLYWVNLYWLNNYVAPHENCSGDLHTSTVCLASLRPPNDGPIYTCSWCSYTCSKVPHLFSQPIHAISWRQLNLHLVRQPSCQAAILSGSHLVRQPSCQAASLSGSHVVRQPSCQAAILPGSYLVRQLSCQAAKTMLLSWQSSMYYRLLWGWAKQPPVLRRERSTHGQGVGSCGRENGIWFHDVVLILRLHLP